MFLTFRGDDRFAVGGQSRGEQRVLEAVDAVHHFAILAVPDDHRVIATGGNEPFGVRERATEMIPLSLLLPYSIPFPATVVITPVV